MIYDIRAKKVPVSEKMLAKLSDLERIYCHKSNMVAEEESPTYGEPQINQGIRFHLFELQKHWSNLPSTSKERVVDHMFKSILEAIQNEHDIG